MGRDIIATLMLLNMGFSNLCMQEVEPPKELTDEAFNIVATVARQDPQLMQSVVDSVALQLYEKNNEITRKDLVNFFRRDTISNHEVRASVLPLSVLKNIWHKIICYKSLRLVNQDEQVFDTFREIFSSSRSHYPLSLRLGNSNKHVISLNSQSVISCPVAFYGLCCMSNDFQRCNHMAAHNRTLEYNCEYVYCICVGAKKHVFVVEKLNQVCVVYNVIMCDRTSKTCIKQAIESSCKQGYVQEFGSILKARDFLQTLFSCQI